MIRYFNELLIILNYLFEKPAKGQSSAELDMDHVVDRLAADLDCMWHGELLAIKALP